MLAWWLPALLLLLAPPAPESDLAEPVLAELAVLEVDLVESGLVELELLCPIRLTLGSDFLVDDPFESVPAAVPVDAASLEVAELSALAAGV